MSDVVNLGLEVRLRKHNFNGGLEVLVSMLILVKFVYSRYMNHRCLCTPHTCDFGAYSYQSGTLCDHKVLFQVHLAQCRCQVRSSMS